MYAGAWADHVSILRCPISGDALAFLSPQELDDLNGAISRGRKVHADGSPVRERLNDGALRTASGDRHYRVEQDIAWLLPVLAIVDEGRGGTLEVAAESEVVRSFYNEFGWVEQDGTYNDSAMFGTGHSADARYFARCNGRILNELGGGRYLLDAASGAVPGPAYTMLSKGYEKRICADFSHAALLQARRTLGAHGLYLLGDLTALPLADGAVDDAMSLHTIYHIPTELQATAVDQLVRVVRPGGKAVIVYEWKSSPLNIVALQITMGLGRIRQRIAGRTPQVAGNADVIDAAPELFFNPQDRRWFGTWRHRYATKLRLWSAASTRLRSAIFRDTIVGRVLANVTFVGEKLFEPLTSRFGQYPMFVIEKR